MIHFYREQVELAVKLVDIKSEYDNMKGLKDVTEINISVKDNNNILETRIQ